MLSVVVLNCSSATGGWAHDAPSGHLTHGGLCATAALPVSSNNPVYMATCSSMRTDQTWVYNATFFSTSAPNISGALLFPKHADTPATYGFTWPKPASRELPWTAIAMYDIGAHFNGECTVHNNCNFHLDASTGRVRAYTAGLCLGVAPYPAPPAPPAPTPPPARNGSLRFSSACEDGMVLQRAPSVAAVYGDVGTGTSDDRAAPSISVRVAGRDALGAATAPYTVAAELVNGGAGWKALLRPTLAGGDYEISVACDAGCNGSASIANATFGDVWYCGGQSNMALPVLHTFSRNETRSAILAGKYNNIRLSGLAGNMNPTQSWIRAREAAKNDSAALFQFSSTCWYFAQALTERLAAQAEARGAAHGAPPIGLIHTSYGGSTIEQWSTRATSALCAGSEPGAADAQSWWDERVVPYLSTTLKGWVWYQGENNCHGVMGNSAQRVGCVFFFSLFPSIFRATLRQSTFKLCSVLRVRFVSSYRALALLHLFRGLTILTHTTATLPRQVRMPDGRDGQSVASRVERHARHDGCARAVRYRLARVWRLRGRHRHRRDALVADG